MERVRVVSGAHSGGRSVVSGSSVPLGSADEPSKVRAVDSGSVARAGAGGRQFVVQRREPPVRRFGRVSVGVGERAPDAGGAPKEQCRTVGRRRRVPVGVARVGARTVALAEAARAGARSPLGEPDSNLD